MVDHQAHQCPTHRCARELGAWIGRLAHVLTPHVSTRLAAVAAHAHVQDRGVPPVGYVSQAPDHRVAYDAFAPTLSAPPVLTHYLAGQDGPIASYTLARHLQSQAIQACERAQVRAIKGSIRHVEVFQMDGVGTPIIERPRPLRNQDTPNAAHNTYTLKCEEPVMYSVIYWRFADLLPLLNCFLWNMYVCLGWPS